MSQTVFFSPELRFYYWFYTAALIFSGGQGGQGAIIYYDASNAVFPITSSTIYNWHNITFININGIETNKVVINNVEYELQELASTSANIIIINGGYVWFGLSETTYQKFLF
jgi:hypothetical protein